MLDDQPPCLMIDEPSECPGKQTGGSLRLLSGFTATRSG